MAVKNPWKKAKRRGVFIHSRALFQRTQLSSLEKDWPRARDGRGLHLGISYKAKAFNHKWKCQKASFAQEKIPCFKCLRGRVEQKLCTVGDGREEHLLAHFPHKNKLSPRNNNQSTARRQETLPLPVPKVHWHWGMSRRKSYLTLKQEQEAGLGPIPWCKEKSATTRCKNP